MSAVVESKGFERGCRSERCRRDCNGWAEEIHSIRFVAWHFDPKFNTAKVVSRSIPHKTRNKSPLEGIHAKRKQVALADNDVRWRSARAMAPFGGLCFRRLQWYSDHKVLCAMKDIDAFDMIKGILAREFGADPTEISHETRINLDLGIVGDDAADLFEILEKETGLKLDIDLAGYFAGEGLFSRQPKNELTVSMLLDRIREKRESASS